MQREKQKIEIAIVHWLGRNDYKKFTDTIEHEYISEDEGQRSFLLLAAVFGTIDRQCNSWKKRRPLS